MIDTEKMKALAAKLRKYTGSGFVVDDATEAADAIDTLLAALEAAAADKRDAERYRGLFDALHRGDIPMKESSISLNVCGVPPDRDEFDEAVDMFISQRQEES